MKTNTSIKATSWVVLATLFGNYGVALAQPGLRESIRSQITDEFEKRYEATSPDSGPSVGDKLLASSSKAIKENVVEMLTDFKMGVVNGYNLAMDGNGTFVVIGAKNGWKLFKEYGEAAGIRYVDSVYLLPKKAMKIGKGFAQAGQNIADIAVNGAKGTAQAWQKAGHEIGEDAQQWADAAGTMNRWAGNSYHDSAEGMVAGIKGGARDAVNWSSDVLEWTGTQTKDAFVDLTQGTVNNLKGTGRWTKEVGKFFVDATVDSARSVNTWTAAAADWTVKATGATWEATTNGGKDVFNWTVDSTAGAGSWLARNATTPANQAINGVKSYSKWNWKKGYSEGLQEGFKTAGNAWDHDDKLMATLWTIAGVGKAGLHILLLEPTVVPMIAAYGVAGTVALSTVGYPSVGAFFLGGMAATGATYAGGTLATGAVALGGGAATVIAGGGGILRTGVTAAVGVSATAGTAAVGTAYTAGAAAVNTVRTIGTPIVGGIGALGAAAGGGAEIVGSVAWGATKMAGITALTGAGYGILSTYELAKMTFSAVQAAGITVFDNAIITPVGVVANLAQALGTGAWTLSEDPVLGTLDVLAAGGIAIGTIATSTGAFSYELVKGIVKGLVHGIAAVGQSGIWLVGAVAKGIEFVYGAFNIPQHRRWAQFRAEEIAEVFETIKKEAEAAISERFGDIILVRVHWWGEDKGHVRFFISKNKQTGERWFFKRIIDATSCEVFYQITNQDPVVRAFTKKAWTGTYATGLFNKTCEQNKSSK